MIFFIFEPNLAFFKTSYLNAVSYRSYPWRILSIITIQETQVLSFPLIFQHNLSLGPIDEGDEFGVRSANPKLTNSSEPILKSVISVLQFCYISAIKKVGQCYQ